MIAYIVLILAALSRLAPHALHGTAINFTAVGAGLLFFGSRRPRWQSVAAVAILAATDFYLTRFVYGSPFEVKQYLVTWAWYAAVCLLASGLLRKVTALRVVTGVLASATSFFLLSNFSGLGWKWHVPAQRLWPGHLLCARAAVLRERSDLDRTAVGCAVRSAGSSLRS